MQKVNLSLNKYLKWFFVFSIVFSVVTIVLMCTSFKTRVLKDVFSDFGETLCYCLEKNPFDNEGYIKSMYPPIAYLIFYPIALICKPTIQQAISGQISIFEMSKNPLIVFFACVYFAIVVALIIWAAVKISNFKGNNKLFLIGILLLWGPFFYCFQRANTILLSSLFILLFFAFYKSNKNWQHQLALIFLALAISIKIYPVFIALIFIKDGRWKDLIKTALYSIVLVFVPLLFVPGNFFENIKFILLNSTRASKELICAGGNVSMLSLIAHLQMCFKFLSYKSIVIISNVLKVLLIACTIVVVLIAKKSNNQFNIFWLLICTYLLIPDVSFAYAISSTLFGFILFLKNFNNFSNKNKIIYSLFFVVLYFQIFYGIKHCFPLLIVLLYIYVKSVVEIAKEIANKKS